VWLKGFIVVRVADGFILVRVVWREGSIATVFTESQPSLRGGPVDRLTADGMHACMRGWRWRCSLRASDPCACFASWGGPVGAAPLLCCRLWVDLVHRGTAML
jgi:hypothetical protein